MCGRFTQHYTWRELVALYRLTQPAINLQPRYNVAPPMTIDAVIPRNGGERLALVPVRWGLIPSWQKKSTKEVPSTFNARAETVAQKSMFAGLIQREWTSRGDRVEVAMLDAVASSLAINYGIYFATPKGRQLQEISLFRQELSAP